MSPSITIEVAEAPYPGAPVLLLNFARGGERGDVRVQDFGELNKAGHRFKVCQFVPGIVECPPGDTPKVWPEVHQYAGTLDDAAKIFDRYVEAVKRAGWMEVP